MYKYIKRIMDIALSLIGLIALSPLFLMLFFILFFDLGFPVIFKQKRFGKNNKMFYIIKFRTLYKNAPKDVPTDEFKDVDKYLSKISKIIRKLSLDELPQLYNILIGEMSIVGPRPALWNQTNLVSLREKYNANGVKPGLTGWAQINGRDNLLDEEKAKYDGYYVENISFLFDLKIFIKTFKVIFENDSRC